MWETSEKKKSDDGEGEQRCKALQHVGAKLGMQAKRKTHGDGICTQSSVLSCVLTSRQWFQYV